MWTPLTNAEQLERLILDSQKTPQFIFKHSTRCSISVMALSRLDRSESPTGVRFHLLDLLSHRQLSNQIADMFGVVHESPQVLLIRNGECIYEESHNAISMEEIVEQSR